MDRRSNPPLADLQVSASAGAIRRRLLDRLLAVRSLWFASPAEQRAWNQAGVPLYVLRDRADPPRAAPDDPRDPGAADPRRIEVGPRLGSLWASCFAPAVEGRFEVSGPNTTVRFRLRWPRPTRALVVAWWAVLVLWAAAIVTGHTEGRPAVFWAFLALASTLGPALGWVLGQRALIEAWPALVLAIEQPEVDEDW